jgi:predicted metal-dependent hydrolase
MSKQGAPGSPGGEAGWLEAAPEFALARELWQRGEFWEVHEVLEPLWLRLEGERREVVHGLILLAAALHKARSSPTGGRRNFAKALRHLEGLPDLYAGIDLGQTVAEVRWALEHPGYRPRLCLAAP